MIRIPGKKEANLKNRSSKNLYILTRRGIQMLNKWNKEKGIPEYKAPRKKAKKTDKATPNEK